MASRNNRTAMANTFTTRTLFPIIFIFIITTTRGHSSPSTCSPAPLDLGDVVFLNNSYLRLPTYGNATIRSTATELTTDADGVICFERSAALKAAILDACRKWEIEEDEYEKLGNGSLVMGGKVMEPGTYEFAEGAMWVCEERASGDDQGGERGVISQEAFVNVGKIGSWVSIVALLAHLVTFCLVPALRNLPGYHLAALSVAFLFGYSFSLIGQIKEVLGAECVAAGILQQYFFLAAFFCMNVMAVDIFRSLRLAACKLAVKEQADRRRQFALYMLYAWGAPLFVTATCALLDALRGAPAWLRPRYGSGDVCWMGNDTAKALFFWAPAFALFAANLVLFVGSAFTVYSYLLMMVIIIMKGSFENTIFCAAVGSLLQFFLASSFMWMFVISLDIFRAVLRATGSLRAPTNRFQHRKYLFQSLGAWGVALVLCAAALVAENHASDLRPAFRQNCWFKNQKSLLVFFAGPVFGVICVNFLLFAGSAYTIFSNRMRVEEGGDSGRSDLRRSHAMYFRLAAIMGVTWMTGALAPWVRAPWLWMLSAALNCFQGFFIFLGFTCTGKTKKFFLMKFRGAGDKRISNTPPTFKSYCYYANSIEKDLEQVVDSTKEKNTLENNAAAHM